MKAEAESVESGGPVVTEADIANIVAQWTGIPIEKASVEWCGMVWNGVVQGQSTVRVREGECGQGVASRLM